MNSTETPPDIAATNEAPRRRTLMAEVPRNPPMRLLSTLPNGIEPPRDMMFVRKGPVSVK